MSRLKKRDLVSLVTGLGDSIYIFEGRVDNIFPTIHFVDVIVDGIKFVIRDSEVGICEGDMVRIYFYLEGRKYRNKYLVNLVFDRFDLI